VAARAEQVVQFRDGRLIGSVDQSVSQS
jgi:hypothetical protein